MRASAGLVVVIGVAVVWAYLTPSLDSRSWRQRERAVSGITDPALLARVVQSDPHPFVRRAAAERISDPATLAQLAVLQDGGVHSVVLANLAEPTLLAEVALAVSSEEAARKLADPALLAKVAAEANAPAAGIAANKLATPEGKALLARARAVHWERVKAVSGLQDQAELARLARSDPAWRVREAAVMRLVDDVLLEQVAEFDRTSYVRLASVAHLRDSTRLLRLAGKRSIRVEDRVAAVERLTDPEQLVHLATEGDEERVQEAALRKLTDQVHLERVALRGKPDISRLAIDRLTDPRRVYEIERSVPAVAGWARHQRVRMSDDEAVLRLGNPKLDEPARDLVGAARRVKLALRSRVIERRLPGLRLEFQSTGADANYLARGLPGGSAHVSTQGAPFRIERGNHPVATKSWEISPPSYVVLSRERVNKHTDITQRADVRAEEVLAELLDAAPFTDAELGELAASEVVELPLAAISRLRGPQQLAGIATGAPDENTRLAAIARLEDRALLGRLVAHDQTPSVRTAAERRLAQIAAVNR